MDAGCIPVFQIFQYRQSCFQRRQGNFVVCFHFLMGIQFCAVFGQSLEEFHQTGNVVQCFQTFLEQSRNLFQIQICITQCFFQLGFCQCIELVKVHSFQVFAVHPCQFLDIEDGRRFAQTSHIEVFFQFFQGEDFLCAGRAPAQQSDIVDDGFYHIAFSYQIFKGLVPVTFGQFMVCVTHNCRQVYIYGRFPAECFVQQVIFGCGGQVFTAAYHVCDMHQVVIHNVCEVISGETVCFHQNLVVQFCVFYSDVAVYHVRECGCAAVGHFLTDYERYACVQFCLYFFFGQTQAVTVIFCESCAFCVAFFQRFQTFFCAEAVVSFAFFHQFFCIVHVHAHTFALYIRTVFAADIGAFIMFQTCHAHGVVNDIYSAFHLTFLVCILNTQDEFPTLGFCNQIFI